jgi:hypothetical protein
MELGTTEKEAIQAIMNGSYTVKKTSEVKSSFTFVVMGMGFAYVYASFTNTNKTAALLVGAAGGFIASKLMKK